MESFTFTSSLPYLAIIAWVEWTIGRTGVFRLSEHATIGLMLGLLPPTVVWLAARAVQLRTPRKRLLAAAERRITTLILGLINGILSAFLVALAAHYLQNMHEAVLIAGALFTTTMTFVYFMGAARPGHCPTCDYDLRGSLDSPRCPECGSSSAGVT